MQKKIIKVATFNLLNLVLPEKKYYDNRKYSRSDYEKKIDWIVYQLSQMNADVIGFQEIFDPEALQEVLDKSGLYKNASLIVAKPTGDLPRVGLLTRFPVSNYKIYEDFPEESYIDVEEEDTKQKILLPFKKFSRPVLRVDVKVHQSFEISFYVVHLKSKRPMLFETESRDNPVSTVKGQARSLFTRAAESVALRTILMETLYKQKQPVVLMGDLNDTGLSVTTRIISGEPPHRKWPDDVKKSIWDVLLYHVKDIQARRSFEDFYFTHIHNGHYESLDQIMVSQELVSENPEHVGKVGYISLINDHLIDQTLTDEKAKPWKTDHGLVLASIELLIDKMEKNLQKKAETLIKQDES